MVLSLKFLKNLSAGLAFLFLFGFALNASGQSSGTIQEILIEGNQRIEAETIRSYMLLQIGDPYSGSAADRSLKTLFRTGLFADVAIRREGDAIVVSVVENPIINRIAFEGNQRIEDAILQAEVSLRPRLVYTRSRVQSDVQRLLQVYRRSGRFAASIEPKIIALDQNRVDLVFEVNEGPLTEVRRIDFVGNKIFDDGDLRDEILTKEATWYRFLSGDTTYDPDRLNRDKELLRRFYLVNGYVDFRIVSAVAELSEDQQEFFITFTIEEGQQYKFGKIETVSRLPKLDLETLEVDITTVEGEIYDAEAVDDTIGSLTDAIGSEGFAFVEVQPRPAQNSETLTVDITFEIGEGRRAYIERINISGNVRTLDEVIRRQFRLAEGDAFNTAKLRDSRKRIQRLGFFENVKMNRRRGSRADQVIVDLEVSEQSTGEISFGVGVSTTESVTADISIRERNFLGRGQDVKVSFALSDIRQQFDIAFTEPYFLDRDIAAGFDIFLIERDLQDQSSYDEDIVGFTLRAGFPVTDNIRQNVSYTLSDSEITGVSDDTSEFIRQEEGSFITSEIAYDLRYDTRDRTFLTTEGLLLRFGQGFAGFGGDVTYARTTATASYFYPLAKGWVGNLALRSGYILGINDDVRITDRFFVGGDSFRGFDTRGIGPRDLNTNDSLGGNLFYVGTAEVSFPLGFADELGMVGRVFTEFGSLTEIDVSGPNLADAGSMRASAGFGVTWTSPLGPIRIDVAEAFLKEDHDETEIFRFSFGTRF